MNNDQPFHVGAVLCRGKRVVHIGVNQSKTHPAFKRRQPCGELNYHLHAEMDAMRFSKEGDVLYVFRFTKQGDLTMAKPCTFCQKFIEDAKLKAVYYSDWNGELQKL